MARQADDALQQLTCFLHRLSTEEQQQEKTEAVLLAQQQHYQQRIEELESQLAALRQPEPLRQALLGVRIHNLPLSRQLQSVLLAGGLYTLEDILHSTCNELQQLPNMTPPLMRELTTYVRSMGMIYKE